MKLGILVCSEPSGERFAGANRLSEAAQAHHHEVEKLYTSRFVFQAKKDGYDIFYDGQPFGGFDALIYRPNFIEEPSLHEYVVRILVASGYRVLNGTADTSATKNKLEQHLIFQEEGFPMPPWLVVKSRTCARMAAEQIVFPLIVKLAFGTHGIGVFYAEQPETLQPIVDYLDIRDGNPMIFEQFISDAGRKDVRVFIVGGTVVAAMKREATLTEVRANIAAGGKGQSTDLSDEEQALALAVAKRFHLDVAGIDILRTDKGPLLLEVNSNPGFKELEAATGKDIASLLIDEAMKIH